MKNFGRNIFISLCACGMLMLAGQVQAHDQEAGHFWGAPNNSQQSEMARDIIERNYANMEGTLQSLSAKRNELDALLASPNPDSAKIESLSREIGELRGKVLAARAQIRSQLIQNGLSPNFLGSEQGNPNNYGGPRGYHHYGPRHRGWGPMGGCMGGCW